MFDDVVVVFKFVGDLMFYVTGHQVRAPGWSASGLLPPVLPAAPYAAPCKPTA